MSENIAGKCAAPPGNPGKAQCCRKFLGELPVSPIPRRIPVFGMRFQIRIPVAANSSQTSSLMRKPRKVRRTGCDFWQCSGSSWRDKLQKARKVHCLSPQESRAPLAGGAFLHVWASLDFSCLFCRSVRALELPCTDNMSIPPLTFRWRKKAHKKRAAELNLRRFPTRLKRILCLIFLFFQAGFPWHPRLLTVITRTAVPQSDPSSRPCWPGNIRRIRRWRETRRTILQCSASS